MDLAGQRLQEVCWQPSGRRVVRSSLAGLIRNVAVAAASLIASLCPVGGASAQDNFEIQVYGSETVAPGTTMVELHSNVAALGTTHTDDGIVRSQGAFHETLEITHGWTSWFETGFYVFTSIQPDSTWQWVGDHIRPRVRAPESWHLPVGLSLSTEIGYQQRSFSTDTWTLEIRPIIDKQWGPWYVSVNPVFGLAIKGENAGHGVDFSPSFKIAYDITSVITAGIEYYAALGPVGGFDRLKDQQQQIFPVIDLTSAPNGNSTSASAWG